MTVSLNVVLLLAINHVFISTTVSSELCPETDWKYHSHTKTCMKAFRDLEDFNGANNKCRNYRGGSEKDRYGHLVFILDEATNNFVKNLINDANVIRAIIALNDRTTQNDYLWGKESPFSNGFYQWKEEEPRSNKYVRTVVITQDGWMKYGLKSYYVCQVDAVFPSPAVSCPSPAQVGELRSTITCSISITANDLGQFKQLSIQSSDQLLADCRSTSQTSCNTAHGYEATFNENDYTAELTIDEVERKHEERYKCTYEFEGVPEKMVGSCDLAVYVSPDEPRCSHTFTDTGVNILCVTDKVYPEGDCFWQYYKNGYNQTLTQTSSTASVLRTVGGYTYYKTTCSISVNINGSGAHTLKVIVFPDRYNNFGNARKGKDTTINITPPTEPPILSNSDGSPLLKVYDVTENDTVTVTCSVQGGSPSVTSTTLTCSKDVRDRIGRSSVTEHGQSVTMIFSASREMDGEHCTCSANHLSREYRQTTSVDFSVKYRATVEYLNGPYSNPKPGEEINLRCVANGNPRPTLKILSVAENGEERTLSEEVTTFLTHKMTVSCRDSGKFVCRGRNNLNVEESVQFWNLRVECPPVHCHDQEDKLKFGAATNKDVVIKLCVFGYPEPTNFALSSGRTSVPRQRYTASFEYNNEATARGEITLTIREIQQRDFGEYDLYTGYGNFNDLSTNMYVYFNLVPKGPPSCPTEVKMIKTYSDKVTLSWKPGFNGGPKQRFIIKDQEGDTIAEVEDTEEFVMLYNITGLTESSSYIFSVDVSNDEGSTECPDLVINITTTALPISQDDTSIVSIIIPVIIIIIIVIVIIIGVIFFMKRRRNKKENIEMSAEYKARGRGDGASLVRGANTENVYANADDNGAGKGNKDKNKGQKKKKEEKQKEKAEKEKMEKEKYTEEATYAVVNKEDKKKKNANMKKPTRKNTEKGKQGVEAIYTPVVKKGEKNNDSARGGEEEVVIENDLYGKSSDLGNEEVVIENDLYGKSSDLDNAEVVIENDLYGKSSDLTTYSNMAVAGNGHGDIPDETVYANETATAPPGLKKEGKKKEEKNKGRTVTPDGLVYVTVEINQKTKNPEIVSDGAESRRPLKPPKPCPQADRVDYVSIDYTAKADGQEKEYANS